MFWERWLHEDDDVNEIVAAVLPLFGRAVIFDGDFPHSATPPSNGGLRMTLAVKMVPGKSAAVRMNFREDSKLEFELNGFVRFGFCFEFSIGSLVKLEKFKCIFC